MFDLLRTIRFAGGVLGFAAMTVGSYYAMGEIDFSDPDETTAGYSSSSTDFAIKESIAAQEERAERLERAELSGDYSELSTSD